MRPKLSVVLASLALIVVLIVACSIYVNRAMRLGYVDSAIDSMRTLVAAEEKYAAAHPETGYTCSMSVAKRSVSYNRSVEVWHKKQVRF